MPSNIPATTIRVEPEVKKEATAILDELGLSMSTAVNAFSQGAGSRRRHAVRDEGRRERKFPFERPRKRQ